MRIYGKAKLGFYPLPVAEAVRLKKDSPSPVNFRPSTHASVTAWHSMLCLQARQRAVTQ